MKTLKHPIVLCHGFLTLGEYSLQRTKMFGYFKKVRRVLENCGAKIYEPKVSPSERIEVRAAELNEFLISEISIDKAHLVCHSMGGLDARFLAAGLPAARKIITLTTLATPHHGTPFADWCVEKIYRPDVVNILNAIGITLAGINDLTTRQSILFNEKIPDNKNIIYHSFSTKQKMSRTALILRFPHKIIASRMSASPENDGLVPESSSRWSGFVRTLSADHLGVLGYIALPAARNDFAYRNFYSELYNLLAESEMRQ